MGWGDAGWGDAGWGDTVLTPGSLSLVAAIPIAENVVRLFFTDDLYVSDILDEFDAHDPSHYSITAVDGTVGFDGQPTRQVAILTATTPVDVDEGPIPSQIDLTLDRPMSPYPAQYQTTVNTLADVTLTHVTFPDPTVFTHFGLLRQLQPPQIDIVIPNRDLANPQSATGIEGSTIGIDTSFGATASGSGLPTLGSFVADSSGDYAFEGGIAAIKKRIFRRGLSRKGSFLHLPKDYAVGLADAVKKLGSAATRDRLAADYRTQILQEPEVVEATVQASGDPSAPQMVRFRIFVRTRTGATARFDHTFNTAAGVFLGGNDATGVTT